MKKWRNKVKRILVLGLTAALIVSTVDFPALVVSASENTGDTVYDSAKETDIDTEESESTEPEESESTEPEESESIELDEANAPVLLAEGEKALTELELFGQAVQNGDSGDGWSYEDNTLTLDNFHTDDSTAPFVHILNPPRDFTIYLKGENSVKTSGTLCYGNMRGCTTITGEQDASLSLEGNNWNDNDIVIKNAKVDITTQGMIYLAQGMRIDNAIVNVNMNSSTGYIYATFSGLTVENGSKVTITNRSGAACCVSADNGLLTVTDSTLSLNGTAAGVHCSQAAITNSQITGIIREFYNSADTPTQYRVYGQSALGADLIVVEGRSLIIPEDAALTIPVGTTLTNNGTMHIHDKASLKGAGTLTGDGSFLIDVAEDMISIPEGLAYTGTDLADQIKLADTVTICGTEFTADTSGWSRSISPSEQVIDAGEYTVTFTKGDMSVSKGFTVAECSHTKLVYAPLEGNRHGGTCPSCGTEVSEEHKYADDACSVCNAKAVVRVKIGSSNTYYGTIDDAWTAACAADSATVTLLANATASTMLCIYSGDNITFDGGSYTIFGCPSGCVFIVGGGKLTITGGTVKAVAGSYGNAPSVEVDLGTLVVTGGTLEGAETNGIGLGVLDGTVHLSGGKFIGGTSGYCGGVYVNSNSLSLSDFLLNYGTTTEPYYAYFDTAGKPIHLDSVESPTAGVEYLSGTVTVAECKHDASVCEYQNNDSTKTHTLTCLACGYTGTEDCTYSFRGNVGTCQNCKDTLTVSVSGTENLIYDGTAKKPKVTVTQAGTALTGGYTVTCSDNINAGTASVTVTIGDNQGTYIETFTIGKADAEITAGTDTYNKTFGDAAFTLDVTVDNREADVQYEVTEGTDVVSVSNDNDTVTIQNAGTAVITVSLPESANYNAAENKTITINVAKKGGYTVDALNRSYHYLPWGGINSIDLAVLLPADCGNVTYGKPETFGNVAYSAEPAVDSGKLSYTIKSGSKGDKGTITVTVETRNYEDITITVNVELTDWPTCDHVYTSEVTKEPTVSSDGEITYTCSKCGDTYTEAIPKKTPEGLWVSGLEQSTAYTGSEVKPEGIRVYHGSTLLREKTEYTFSYKNNTNAGTAQVIVTGKGSYQGKATAEFTIEAIDLSTDMNISAVIATAAETGKNLKPTVTVTWNGRKLKEKTDYTLTYDADIKTASAEGYDVTISGQGNYTGVIVRKFRVAPRETPLLNSAKVTGLAKSYPYQEGKEIPEGLEADLEKLSVKIGKTSLTKGTDYTVRVENGNTVGTGTIVIEAAQTSAYAGEKRIPISITGTSLKKCCITGLEKTYPYTGAPVMPEIKVYTGKNGTGTQIPPDAYTVRYSNHINQGKATITVTGAASKGYSGSVKATYTIGRCSLATEESAGNITVAIPIDIKYAKGGAKPQPVITHTDSGALREGVDYTLKYSSNTSASGKTRPALKITGIGNYCGTITKNFDIGAQDIGTLEIAAADKAYSRNKKGSGYYSAPQVYDLDGKQLKSGKDYIVRYTNAATGQEIGKKDTIENGTEIRVTVTAAEKSSYIGTLSTVYYVRDAKDVKDIAKAKYDKIASRQYTGSEIRPEVSLYTLTGKTKNYLTAKDYEIIGYYDNVKKGTATILIRGANAYSGVMSITFKITAADNQSIWSGIL